MRLGVIAGVVGVWLATSAQAQTLPVPFENVAQIVCTDQTTATALLAVYDEGMAQGDEVLALLAARGACERATFSGKPVADVHATKHGGPQEGHVFEVEVTTGEVLKGRTRAYMVLYVFHDNEAAATSLWPAGLSRG